MNKKLNLKYFFISIIFFILNSHIETSQLKVKIKNKLRIKKSVPEANMTMKEILKKHEYGFETHSVTTEDGYILKLFRILSISKQLKNTQLPVGIKKAVLFQHGLFVYMNIII
jgi:hypothetical protein